MTMTTKQVSIGILPGLLRTSYASLTVAILASDPPLSGCAVMAALRLQKLLHEDDKNRHKNTHKAFLIVFESASRDTPSTL